MMMSLAVKVRCGAFERQPHECDEAVKKYDAIGEGLKTWES
jgi:hypothetical protein